MKTSEKVLQLLLKKQAFLSGQELADELNVSRTAVWKAIQSLQEEGYQIESKPRIGYRYIEGLKLSEASIRRFLNPELDLNFEIYDTIDSTNNRCSQKAMDPETKTPLVVISDSQKAGHGRYGRPFASPVGGGIYISILLDNDDPDFNPVLLTTATAIAVTRTIEKLIHARCEIKWVNDVLVDGKKIVGILCEVGPDGHSIVVGIGINLAQPQEYFDAAGLPHGTSLALQGVPVDMDTDPEWLAQYMTDFGFDRALYTYEAEGFAPYRERYKALCVNLGRRVTYDGGAGTAVDVDDEGRLIVRDETGDTRVFTGEVSVKGIYGAV